MKGVLLCAGYATRMGALTANFPKALLPVAGKPILDDLVDGLADTGVFDELIVVTNHRDYDHFVDWRASREGDAPQVRLLDDGTTTNEERLGAIGDLALAVEEIGAAEPLLVAAGDNLFRFDWNAYLEAFRSAATSMVLLAHETDSARLSRSGVALVDESGRLLRLFEKPKNPPSEFCCPPVYCLSPAALAEIEPCRVAHPTADAPGHLIAWLAEHLVVRTHLMRGKRLDVGDAASYAAAEEWLRSLPSSSAVSK